MKMFRWMSGVTKEDRVSNKYVRGSIGVPSIVNKLRENILNEIGHNGRKNTT